jgi:hypothetical protein
MEIHFRPVANGRAHREGYIARACLLSGNVHCSRKAPLIRGKESQSLWQLRIWLEISTGITGTASPMCPLPFPMTNYLMGQHLVSTVGEAVEKAVPVLWKVENTVLSHLDECTIG